MTPDRMVLKKMFDSLKVDAHRFSLIYSWISNFVIHSTICHMDKQICPGVIPNVIPRVQKVVPRVPKVIPRVPKVIPRVTKVIPRVPEVIPRVQKVIPGAPKVVPRD